MKKAVLLVGLLALAGCDGLTTKVKPEPQVKETVAPDFATQAESVVKKALDDWVFGDANYKLASSADIRFGDLDYNTGVPLTSYEIVATKEMGSDMAVVAVRLVFPTRGGVHEIKKSVSYTVWNAEEGYWQTGPAIDASVKRGISAGN
jgi:hypothetical protein